MPFLEIKNLEKRFPGVLALDRVSFSVERGSCHALIGENGAGKSTIGKILAGVLTADSGEIFLAGDLIAPATPLEARKLGIAMVHQELAFCPNLSVAENLCLGDLPQHGGWVDRREMSRRASSMLGQIDARIDPSQPIGELSTGQEQIVQIAAAIGTGAKVIIMDEPTSSLSVRESEHLFQLIVRLKQTGITLIYISHRMAEIFQLCDHITVLRDGREVATAKTRDTDPHKVVQWMIGRELTSWMPSHLSSPLGKEVLRVENLASPQKFRDIRFTLRAGEILGMAGLVGAGRSEIAQAIFGLDPAMTGNIFVDGKEIRTCSVQHALAAGIGLLPEDRKKLGLVLTMNCRENTTLALLREISQAGFLMKGEEQSIAARFAAQLQVKAPSIETPVASLSGGNQQKIALVKWLARACSILIIDEPTRGVDVGAKQEIHLLLDELACKGVAILLISSELPEVMNLSRRVLVMREGICSGEVERANFSETGLMRLMAGVSMEERTITSGLGERSPK